MIALAALFLAATQPNPELVDLVKMVEESYQSRSVIEARLEQKTYWVNLDQTVSSAGTIWLGDEGAIRLEYETGGRIVSDGDSIWVYVPESEQVFISRADTSNLLSPARLVAHFIERSDSIGFDRIGEGWTVEFRMKPGKKLELLSATIRKADHMVPRLFMKDAEGNETEIELEYVGRGIDEESLFAFSKPAGVEVVRQ